MKWIDTCCSCALSALPNKAKNRSEPCLVYSHLKLKDTRKFIDYNLEKCKLYFVGKLKICPNINNMDTCKLFYFRNNKYWFGFDRLLILGSIILSFCLFCKQNYKTKLFFYVSLMWLTLTTSFKIVTYYPIGFLFINIEFIIFR